MITYGWHKLTALNDDLHYGQNHKLVSVYAISSLFNSCSNTICRYSSVYGNVIVLQLRDIIFCVTENNNLMVLIFLMYIYIYFSEYFTVLPCNFHFIFKDYV